MGTDKHNAIRSLQLLFKNTKDKTLLFTKQCLVVLCKGHVIEVKDVVHIMALSGCYEVSVPGMPETVFLEDIVVGNTPLDTLPKFIDR